ncbi:hypothetical protein [Pyxidicoccus trucidator]|uniref:hypothetical protein n=1 Tax=Pyxidicoccus trucidator TaxID=2709662 RepID=UPI001F086F20|nr:hypothetical protein [Pyxidicoccus trucidator]
MSPSPMSEGLCQESTGFLFSHECGLPAGAGCPRCGKRVCDAHLTSAGGELVCATCAEDTEEGDESDSDSDSDSGPDSDSSPAEDDPSYYYKDYGYYGPGSSWAGSGAKDPNDFTEADGESLRHEGDSSFEEDLGGS